MIKRKSLGFTWFLVLILKTGLVYTQTDVFNICDIERVKLHHEGQTGTVLFDGPSTTSSSPCILRLQALPNTYISVQPANTFTFGKCYGGFTTSLCTDGCSYAYLFDGFYFNDTLRYITKSDWTHYNTSSSVLYVAVCHSFTTNVVMKLKYTTIQRRYVIEGDSMQQSVGHIMSPYFPNNYIQNGEQVTYHFVSRLSTDKVVLLFDDYDIAPGGALYFHPSIDYSSPIKISDESNRPVVTSTQNQLQFIFDNGWPAGSYRKYLGFKATYRFIGELEPYKKPTTYCGRYYITLNGGEIEFRPNRFNVPYDCVWVVKTQPGYKATYMKLDRFSSDYGNNILSGKVSIDVHAGLTSNGTIIGTLYPSNGGFREFEDKEGFYVRLRGSFSSSATFRMAFTSYIDFYASGCDTSTHFLCSSKKCIPNQLSCDHLEHCPDGTDETIGCSGRDNYQSSHETLTVSIIVPLVVSIFLLSVLCIIFVLVRRCRQARQFNEMNDSIPSVHPSERRRGRGRDDYFRRPADAPPTYDEALITGIPVPDNDIGPSNYDVPKPPPYSEAVESCLVEESSMPSPPYYSRENINQSFVEDHVEHCGTSGSVLSEVENVPHDRFKPSVHLTSSGRLPTLPSSSACTQSMIDVSVVRRNDMSRCRSEQILSSTELNAGFINHGFIDDHTSKPSNLPRGHAVSNLELPAADRKDHAVSNLELPAADRKGCTNNIRHTDNNLTHTKQDQNTNKPSARERLKPKNPQLKKVYNEELNRKEKHMKSIIPPDSSSPQGGHHNSSPQGGHHNSSPQGGHHSTSPQSGHKNTSTQGGYPSEDEVFDHREGSDKQLPRERNGYTKRQTRNDKQTEEENRSDKEKYVNKFLDRQNKGSNLSLNLNVGQRNTIHRSCMSLNENLIRHIGAKQDETGASCLNFNSNEDVYV